MAKAIFLRKGPNGLLLPADDDAREKLDKYKLERKKLGQRRP